MRDEQMDAMIKQTEVMLESEEIRMSRIRDRNASPYNQMNLQYKVMVRCRWKNDLTGRRRHLLYR